MHEVITFSLSQQANHLSTHFYNAQESYLDYTSSASSSKNKTFDPSVHFKPTLTSHNTVNYTPRALIWDLKGGLGALGKFEYFPGEQPDDEESEEKFKSEIITKERIAKNEYQKALDNGSPLPKLSVESTRYWTDYSRVLYEPKSLNVLSDWEFDPKRYPEGRLSMGKERAFFGHDVGIEEWSKNGQDFLEDNYRISLEECDLLNGLNVVTEIDSAWGGFSSELLSELREDYNPKSDIMSFGLFNGKSLSSLSNPQILSRIKSFISIHSNSSLFFPTGIPTDLPTGIDSSSLWHTSALENLVLESIQVLSSQIGHDRKSLNSIIQSLTLGSDRKLVTSITASIGENKPKLNFSDNFTRAKKDAESKGFHDFASTKIIRPSKSSGTYNLKELSSEIETRNNPNESQKSEFISKSPFPTPDSYPDFIVDEVEDVEIELSVDTRPSKILNEMKDFVSKYLRSGDERQDLLEEIENLKTSFEYGWDDDGEVSDDDY